MPNKKKERSQINNLALQLKELEKKEQIKPKISKRTEITKIRAQINSRKTIEKINETKSCFFKKR